jgi:hypothetical protein
MKKLFISAAYCALHLSSHAQTVDEWFFQQKIRIRYLIQQAAALLAYRLTAEKGLQIAGAGIDTIGGIDQAAFNLDRQYIQSLETVNPVIKSSPLVGKIEGLQSSLTDELSESMALWEASSLFDKDAQHFVTEVDTYLAICMDANRATLSDLLTDGKLTMSDGERMSAIQAIYADTQKQYRFVIAFSRTVAQMIYSKNTDARELDMLKKLLYE